jgi:hypothetical protein
VERVHARLGENDLRKSSATRRHYDYMFSQYHGITTFIECQNMNRKESRHRDACVDDTSMAEQGKRQVKGKTW